MKDEMVGRRGNPAVSSSAAFPPTNNVVKVAHYDVAGIADKQHVSLRPKLRGGLFLMVGEHDDRRPMPPRPSLHNKGDEVLPTVGDDIGNAAAIEEIAGLRVPQISCGVVGQHEAQPGAA